MPDNRPPSTTAAAEAELRRSQALRQIVGRIAKIGGWELDLVTNERVWSDDARRIFELTAEAAPDIEAVYAMHDADARQQLLQAVENARLHGQAWDLTLPATTPSGRRIWVRSIGVPEVEDGKAVRISGAVQDVTDVRATEESRTELLERLALATSTAGIGIFDWNAVTRTRTWDKRNCQLWGVMPGTPLDDATVHSIIHPDDLERVRQNLGHALTDGSRQYSDTFRIRHSAGVERVLERQAVIFRDAQGKALRLLGMTRDITDSHRAAEELRAAKNAAEAATRTKSAFLANVSHEIRTPMNGVIGMTGLLLETDLEPTQRDYAETIRTSADALLTVINDLLDFSKIEAGRLDIEALEMDLRGNVEDVGAMMAFQAAAKDLELIVNVRPEVPDRVLGDAQRIRQCLINLVGNAIKFTQTGEVAVDVYLLGRQDGRALVHFEVRDSGIGIDPAALALLFEPFTQADASTTRHFGGTGLGLSIVARLVEMMGGKVGAESQPGVGSIFWFTLPLEPVEAAAAGPAARRVVRGQRVLIVDDNSTNRHVLHEQLTHVGYDVAAAASGAEALTLLLQARAANRRFEVVLADYQMPDMDGAELAAAINGDPTLSDTRLVMLTSVDRHGDISRFARLGFAAYLTKPVRASELFDCLGQVLAREAREWHMRSQPMLTRTSLVEATQSDRYTGHVLLVEDNAVNQKVAERFLERLGCRVTTVADGAAAVIACNDSAYDLVFMDMQMPVMDGLTATRHIRKLDTPSARVPIVALTANAMPGQLERCLAAGMNAYLTKPLEIGRLRETLDRFGLARQGSVPSPAQGTGIVPGEPVEVARLLELTAGDKAFALQIVETFAQSGDRARDEMRSALSDGDRNRLQRAAHQLKGASANIHAARLRDLATTIENRSGNAAEADLAELLEKLGKELDRVSSFLRRELG
jgi:two-component system sensor histidine kinase/response regulator